MMSEVEIQDLVKNAYIRGFNECQRQVCDALNEIEDVKHKSRFIQSQFAYDVATEIIRRHINEG